MQEIKVGWYVRTKDGYILKIVNINEFREPSLKYGVETNYLPDVMFIGDEDIIKSSSNIIDLIQVGDYVNSKKVIEVDDCKGAMREIYLEGQNPEKDCGIYFEMIESVVTREQFERCEYKI